MKEIITIEQANHLMLAFILVAPIIGLIIGAAVKQVKLYGIGGVVVGLVNYVLWLVYSAITNKLGLDTVLNLVVNLAFFVIVGVVVGILLGRRSAHKGE